MQLESNHYKWIYIVYMFLIVVPILGFGWIGSTDAIKNVLNFYLLWLLFPATVIFILDFVTKGHDLEEIDTVTWEEPHFDFLSPKIMFLIGLTISAVIGWQIVSQGVGLVGVPKLSIFSGELGNALLAGLIGLIENFMFFGSIYPSTRKIVSKYSGSLLVGIIVASLITVGAFTGYHMWRYGMDESALVSVLFFAALNVAFIQVSNSLLWSDMLHFTNNFLVALGWARNIVVALIL